jgi:hypothetical protein
MRKGVSIERAPYKQPPEHTRFKEGVSGNPPGRPKKRATLLDALLDELQRPAPGGACSNQRAIAKSLVAAALDGHFASASLIVSLVVRLQSVDGELGAEQRATAEDDILDHVLDQSPANGERPELPQLSPPGSQGGGDHDADC